MDIDTVLQSPIYKDVSFTLGKSKNKVELIN